MSLNAEPSQPDERAAQDLPPKSYAAAAEQAVEEQSHESQADSTKERVSKNVQNMKANGKIRIPSEEDKELYEGEGVDSSPKSPARAHRRKTSLKSNGSIGKKHGERVQSDVYEKHADSNGQPLTSVKPSDDYEKDIRTDRKPMRRNSELKSGRQAGAGWHRSKYVEPLGPPAEIQDLFWQLTSRGTAKIQG